MKKISLNIMVAAISNIVTILFSIIAQRFILVSFGTEINGLTASITQFLTYFTMLEAGLGLASIQALYKPIANEDEDSIRRILTATTIQYYKIGVSFFGLTIVLAIAMAIVLDSNLDPLLIFEITILLGMSSVISYLFIGRYQVLLTADRKVYIINTLNAILGIVFNIIKIIMINSGYSIITVLSVALLSPILRLLFLYIYTNSKYSYAIKKSVPNFEAINKRKYVFIHQVVGLITNQSSILLLTIFSTLNEVSKYSIYNLVYSHLFSIISTTFSTATQASFGRWIEKKDPKIGEYYEFFEILFTFILFCLLSIVFIMTIPFVFNYTKNVNGIDYIDDMLAFLFMISTLFSSSRIPALMMINATGNFAETQRGAIIEAVLSITVSIPCFFLFGVNGVVLGMCVAIFYRAIDVQLYTYHYILKTSIFKWIKLFGINVILMIVYIIFFRFVVYELPVGWWAWLLYGIKQGLISALLFFCGCSLFYGRKIIVLWKDICGMKDNYIKINQ